MPLILIRHGERQDYIDGEHFINNTTRPWDPPLTERGKRMSVAAGEAIRDFIKKHNLPPVTQVISSPLERCVQTCKAAIWGYEHGWTFSDVNGISESGTVPNTKAEVTPECKLEISIEPSLVESACEAWFRSWGCDKADGTWGGPRTCTIDMEVDYDKLHPAVHSGAGKLYMNPQEHAKMAVDGVVS